NSNYLLSDLTARGHEFHYSTYQNLEENRLHAYETRGMRGVNKEGYLTQNLVAGYTHFHFASNPAVVDNWIRKCLQYKKSVSFISFE
ncbi:cobyrinic acid a,c-diamide synthase, partial [Butyricicoccus sp. 1XD8-22]